jgi:hypothetical protein
MIDTDKIIEVIGNNAYREYPQGTSPLELCTVEQTGNDSNGTITNKTFTIQVFSRNGEKECEKYANSIIDKLSAWCSNTADCGNLNLQSMIKGENTGSKLTNYAIVFYITDYYLPMQTETGGQ